MDSLLLLLLIGAAALALFSNSFIAKILKAKRYRFYWMILTWLLTFIAIVAANLYQLDGLYVLLIGISTFFVSLLVLNGMKPATAFTTAISGLAIITLFSVAILVLLQQAGSDTRGLTATALGLVPESEFYNVNVLQKPEPDETDLYAKEAEDIVYSESDLLPNRVVKAPVIRAHIYHEVDPRKAGSMKGASIRLLKTDGKTVKGSIVGVKGNRLIIGKYVASKGMIQAPVAFASIKKLEVLGR